MKRHTTSDLFSILLFAGRIVLGVLFIYASWDKVLDPAAFADIVANYQILPHEMVNAVALGLPWLELVCGICLVTNFWTRGSALIVVLLMMVFIAALGYSAFRGLDVACGCFTMTGQAPKSMWIYLLRDAAMLALATAILILPKASASVLTIFSFKTKQDSFSHDI